MLTSYNSNNEAEKVRYIIENLDPTLNYNLVLGGDLNFIQDTLYDSDGGTPTLNHSSIAELHYHQSQRDLVDMWCIRNPSVKRFTYRQHKPLIQRRLDYFLLSDYLQDYTKHTDIIPAVLTDHSAIILKLSGSEGSQRGHSYWKFNNSLLTDNVYLGLMREKIDEFSAVNYFPDDLCLGWEFLKYKLKNLLENILLIKKLQRMQLGSTLNQS